MNPSSSLNAIEVAELLKITKNTVYELIKRGELPAYKVGRKLRVDKEDVENYINKQKGHSSISRTLNSNIYESATDSKPTFPNLNKYSTDTKNEVCEIVIAGQDIILDILARFIERHIPGTKVLRTYIGSYNGLYELYNSRVSISSAHLWDKDSSEYNTPFVKMLLPGIPCTLINLAYRKQGFYVIKDNPKNITKWEDLSNPNIKLVNREKGSGTRVLLDGKLTSHNINQSNLIGYDYEETSHLSVASSIARGIADVGIGSEKAALQVRNIDFIPLQRERYDLVLKNKDLDNSVYQEIINIINSNEFKSELEGIGGYDLTHTGCVVGTT